SLDTGGEGVGREVDVEVNLGACGGRRRGWGGGDVEPGGETDQGTRPCVRRTRRPGRRRRNGCGGGPGRVHPGRGGRLPQCSVECLWHSDGTSTMLTSLISKNVSGTASSATCFTYHVLAGGMPGDANADGSVDAFDLN